MKPGILPYTGNEYLIPEGCYIVELSNSELDPELSIARARVEPGVTTQWHTLIHLTERYVILEGSGQMEMGELEASTVGPGDTVLIPPRCPQRITNTGDIDLVFLAICTPRFEPHHYQALE